MCFFWGVIFFTTSSTGFTKPQKTEIQSMLHRFCWRLAVQHGWFETQGPIHKMMILTFFINDFFLNHGLDIWFTRCYFRWSSLLFFCAAIFGAAHAPCSSHKPTSISWFMSRTWVLLPTTAPVEEIPNDSSGGETFLSDRKPARQILLLAFKVGEPWKTRV